MGGVADKPHSVKNLCIKARKLWIVAIASACSNQNHQKTTIVLKPNSAKPVDALSFHVKNITLTFIHKIEKSRQNKVRHIAVCFDFDNLTGK